MGSTVFPAASAASKTRYVTTLTSGTSYTVPAGVTYVNVKLFGGGGGSGQGSGNPGQPGIGGRIISSTVVTIPGASIAYAIGAGGALGANVGATGGSTTFTGATTATGGVGGNRDYGAVPTGVSCDNGGGGHANNANQAGGAGQIELEYWL